MTHRIRYIVCKRMGAVLALAALAAARCGAAEVATYTLDECLRMGLANSAAATKSRLDQDISETVVKQARSEVMPQLSLSATYTRMDEVQNISFGDQSMEVGSLNNYQAQADVSQLLYSGGRVSAALKAANLTRRHAHWSALNEEAVITRDIRVGFTDILFARAAVAVREESVAQFQAQASLVERRHQSGTVSEFDAISARVRLANERPNLINARNALDVARENFRRLLGLKDPAFDISGELVCRPAAAGLEDLQRLALVNRPALRQLEAVVGLREQDVAAAGSKALPSLRARFSYAGAVPYGYVALDNEWQWHWNAGLVAEWDVWDGGMTRASVRQKRLELAKARTDLDELKRVVRMEVTMAYLEMQRAREAVQAGEGTVRMAEKGLAIAKSRYDTGLSTLIEFTDSNLALSTARLQRHQAMRDHMAAVAQLQYACGADIRQEEEKNDHDKP